jgi:GGDEF domain-containing protein/CHASE3 domain sensor protein
VQPDLAGASSAWSAMNRFTPRAVLEAMTPDWLFARLSISKKMLLGYLLLVILSVIVVVYALISLKHLNNLNTVVIQTDVPVQEAANAMIDAILGQDLYEKRYLVLMRKDSRSFFWKRSREFSGILATLQSLPSGERYPLKILENLHREYDDLFLREIKLARAGDLDAATALSNRDLKEKLDRLVDILKTVSADARQSQEDNMKKITSLGGSAVITTAILCGISLLFGILAGLVVTHNISSSIGKLKGAASRVAEGDFLADPHIDTKDEIGDLSEAFLRMGRRLGKLEEMYLDASPLTRLPGGIAIEHVLKRRLKSGDPIAFCMLDLDNFKAFNDHYGYARGNDVIKDTAQVIEAAVKTKGSPDDFVGHIGGDDFVVITTPVTMRAIGTEIIRQFDEHILPFYDAPDRERGYILGRSREGEERRFPFMTISIAIVTNEQRTLSNPIETSEIAAELKDYAKTIQKSVYIVDKRREG